MRRARTRALARDAAPHRAERARRLRWADVAHGCHRSRCQSQSRAREESQAAEAPDLFVRLNHPQPAKLGSWKVWLDGGIDLGVEVVSPNEDDGITWQEKLARYHQLGVSELVRFDPEAPEGQRLRAWDRVEGDLVERQIGGDRTPCLALGLAWCVRTVPAPNGAGEYVGLRLVDNDGRLLETEEEANARRADTEARARAAEGERADAAEARIRELEEQLRAMKGRG